MLTAVAIESPAIVLSVELFWALSGTLAQAYLGLYVNRLIRLMAKGVSLAVRDRELPQLQACGLIGTGHGDGRFRGDPDSSCLPFQPNQATPVTSLSSKLFYHGAGMAVAAVAYILIYVYISLSFKRWVAFVLGQLVVRLQGALLMQSVSARVAMFVARMAGALLTQSVGIALRRD
jgi:hypothetical protein